MPHKPKRIVLIGGGIMSATLGVMLQELFPDAQLQCFERLPQLAEESSEAWNNAGTGHAAYCELNYTPEDEFGQIHSDKALRIAEQFQQSLQFWMYLISKQKFKSSAFIHSIPHCSFVFTEQDKHFLQRRFNVLSKEPMFASMHYSESIEELHQWFPLVMEQRKQTEHVAATYMEAGTDVDFGLLTEMLFEVMIEQGAKLFLHHEVQDIERTPEGWRLEIENLANETPKEVYADFVFIGAGGGSLKLLNKADIPEVDGYAGFPVGGKWLRCTNPSIIEKHQAKVYGKAAIGAPPMSVPHLDTRIIQSRKELLFGPYAGFSTKFLKHGELSDLPFSIDWDNLIPLTQVGLSNIPLTKYLIEQVLMSKEDKCNELRLYYPEAKQEDWELLEAGQRVQVIKKNKEGKGVLEFGTELIRSADGSLAGLLGASPGASTAVSIMLHLVQSCFPNEVESPESLFKLRTIIPGYGRKLNDHPEELATLRNTTKALLFS